MVKHIVVYTLKEGVDKDAAVKLIASSWSRWLGRSRDFFIWRSAAAMPEWTMPCIPSLKRQRMFLLTASIPSIRKQKVISIICWIPGILQITKYNL